MPGHNLVAFSNLLRFPGLVVRVSLICLSKGWLVLKLTIFQIQTQQMCLLDSFLTHQERDWWPDISREIRANLRSGLNNFVVRTQEVVQP